MAECAKNQLKLFQTKEVQYSVLKTEQVALKPLSTLDGAQFIQFLDQGYGDSYKNLSKAYLHLKVKLNYLKDNGDAETDAVDATKIKIAPVNNFLHSLFRQVTLSLNGKQVAQNCQNYPYRSYIENVLNFDKESAHQHCQGLIWSLDTPKHFDTIGGLNLGSTKRATQFPLNQEIELVGRLHLDMFNTPKYLLNNVDVGLTLELSKSDFYLMKPAKNASNLSILDATLYMEHVSLNPEVFLAHQKILEQNNAIYNYKHCDVRNYTIPQNSNSYTIDNVHNGTLPELILVAMVDNSAYLGDNLKNPFNFQNFDLNTFSASVNGIEIAPRNLTFDFKKTNPVSQHAYFQLFQQLNLHKFDRANSIDRELFNDGCLILAFDLTPDREGDCLSVPQSGALRFEAKFKEKVTNAITVLVYLQFDAELSIDHERNVFTQMF